jgi:hypothetical protein
LLAVLRLLRQQPVYQRHQILQLRFQWSVNDLVHLPLDVAQHAPGIALETAQRLAHPLELPGMSIAPDLSANPGAEAVVVLPQADASLARQPDQLAPCGLVKPGIRWVGDVLFHHRGIDGDLLQMIVLHRPGALPSLDRLGEQPFHTLLTDPVAPAGHRRGINRQPMLKERLAAEMLPVWVLGPAGHNGFIRQSERVLEIEEPRDQAGRRSGATDRGREQPHPFPLEDLPVDQGGELHQFVAHVDHFDQAGTQEIVLFRGALYRLHITTRNCRVLAGIIRNLAIQDQ